MQPIRVLIFFVCFSAAPAVFALPVTDFISFSGRDWAQVDLFTNQSWRDVSNVCAQSTGQCSGLLSGFDLAGWNWASNEEVGDFLFGPLTSHPGGAIGHEAAESEVNDFFAATGFREIGHPNIKISGQTRDQLNIQLGGRASITVNRFGALPYMVTTGAFGVIEDRLTTSGAWFFRNVQITNVPEPNAAFLLLFGTMIITVLTNVRSSSPGS